MCRLVKCYFGDEIKQLLVFKVIFSFFFCFSHQVDGVALNLAKRNDLIGHLFTLLEQKKTFR